MSKEFGVEKSTFVVEGDRLIMTAEGGSRTLQFKRVAKKDTLGRIEHIEKLQKKE
ncbi:MAG: hypothetical protein OSB05_02630 [Akkermansiaceae bacterium]|nr:hypothetical protein [Akkermansiaceae bacterium]